MQSALRRKLPQRRYQATPTVFVTGADPLKLGFVAKSNKPAAISRIWMVLTTLAEKRLQLLHDLLPRAEQIGCSSILQAPSR